jgi:hypothetical protein
MAHFAKIENSIVTAVVVVDNEHEADGEAFLNSLGLDGKWVQTSYNSTFGKKFAALGDTYDARSKVFKPAKPTDDATWDAEMWGWIVPAPAEVAPESTEG